MPSGHPEKQLVEKNKELSPVERALDAVTQKNFGEAAELYRALLKLAPDNAAFWRNLSIALRGLGQREAALGCARRAAALEPSSLDSLVNVSDSLLGLCRIDEALGILSKAVAAEPKNVPYRRRYADALRQSKKFEEALAQIDAASKIEPDDVETNWQRAVTRLTLGHLGVAWKDYEVRWKRGNLKERTYNAQRWTGQDLTGKTIFLYEEQGFGDTILATRYIPLVKQRGARVLFGCKPALHKLLETVPGIDRLPQEGALGEKLDYHASLLSLPGIFGTELNTIPPLVKLNPAKQPPAAAAKLLQLAKDRLRVGIIWSGSPDFKDNYKRAVSFTRFLPLAEIPGVQLYSLQKGAGEKELAEAGATGLIPELGPLLNDFAETAAVLQELDLIIMTDSSVAHLAGTLGRPVWNLLNFDPYWLYMADRADSPWYPSLRLFRQPKPGDWDSVFKEVAVELGKIAAAKVSKK